MTIEDITTEQGKSNLSKIDFTISIIRTQIEGLKVEASKRFLENKIEEFQSLRAKIIERKNGDMWHTEAKLAYNIVSNYYDACSRIMNMDAQPSHHLYNASVAQLRDELWDDSQHE